MKLKLIVLSLLIAQCASAQEQTLIGSREIDHGGYGALVVKYTQVNEKDAVLVGARGGWIIDHTFSVGVAGYGLMNNVRAYSLGLFGQKYVNLGYGGLDLECVLNSDRLVHFSVHSLVGAGVVGFRHGLGEDGWDNSRGDWFDNSWYHSFDTFFVFEPGVNLDVNITRWFRMSVGASYRHITGVSSNATTDRDISGPSGMLSFRFGSF